MPKAKADSANKASAAPKAKGVDGDMVKSVSADVERELAAQETADTEAVTPEGAADLKKFIPDAVKLVLKVAQGGVDAREAATTVVVILNALRNIRNGTAAR